jgi:hypothetical protein
MSTSFRQLIDKVAQAENALEAQERRLAADLRQLKASWRAGWTPGRIIIAGLVGGFVIGRVEPARAGAKGSTIMQMITAVSGLMATATAKQAATEAESAATEVEQVADAVGAGVPHVSGPPLDAVP